MSNKKAKGTKEIHSENGAPFPAQVQKHLDALLQWCMQIEKKHYQNPLVPFEQHAKQMKLNAEKYFSELQDELMVAQALLKEQFVSVDRAHPEQHVEDAFAIWETAARKMQKMAASNEASFIEAFRQKPLQEILSIPWPFMDRAYRTAQSFFAEKKFEEAEAIYFFLHMMNPTVMEYWFGEGMSLQLQEKFEEAASRYIFCQFLQPENPLPFFQLSRCLYYLEEKESAVKAAEFCIELAKKKDEYMALLKNAERFKQAMEREKVA